MRYFLDLSYNGTSFHGWQSQPNAVSVQSTIEKALSILIGENISVVGAGRTDAGVHAKQMFAHFDIEKNLVNQSRFLASLNSLIGKDIVINKIIDVPEDSHARFDAVNRTYKYFISFVKNPFLKEFCWFSPNKLDITEMNFAAQSLINIKDFTSFAKLHSDVKTNICDVREAFWQPIPKDKEASEFLGGMNDGIVFTISADRFLRNMVRAIVGTLIDVGRKKINQDQFLDIVRDRNRNSAGTSMPARGLFLWSVSYPFLKT